MTRGRPRVGKKTLKKLPCPPPPFGIGLESVETARAEMPASRLPVPPPSSGRTFAPRHLYVQDRLSPQEGALEVRCGSVQAGLGGGGPCPDLPYESRVFCTRHTVGLHCLYLPTDSPKRQVSAGGTQISGTLLSLPDESRTSEKHMWASSSLG